MRWSLRAGKMFLKQLTIFMDHIHEGLYRERCCAWAHCYYPHSLVCRGRDDKSASSTKATVHQTKPKKGWSDTVRENASYPYSAAPAYVSPSLEFGYMDIQSYGPIGASALG